MADETSPSKLDVMVTAMYGEYGIPGLLMPDATMADKVAVLDKIRERAAAERKLAAESTEGKKIVEQIAALNAKLAVIGVKGEAAAALFQKAFETFTLFAQMSGDVDTLKALGNVDQTGVAKRGRKPS